jgi:hypothetical protein
MKFLLLPLAAMALNAQTADAWKPIQFLTGEWVGEGAGTPGASAGACSFTFDLDQKVLVRKSIAEAPSYRHEDLMVIYFEKGLQAIYFDNEDHVIHYSVESSPGEVRFLNDRYRLIYRKTRDDRLLLDFDVAEPGKPFANYLHATLRKK